MTKRPRDTAGLARLIVDMATGEVPSDTPEVLAEMNGQEPTGRAKSARARAASQTPERRREVAQKAAAARWEGLEPAEGER
ncbi:MAG: hypothetical protein OXQ31_03190 [Spirochaetaceae bacterium]|nr:hypothetical protein [Spirochaetaceae bacterium]